MITKEELQALDAVFTLARQQVVANEQQLISLINFKQKLFKKLIQKESKEEIKEETKKETK